MQTSTEHVKKFTRTKKKDKFTEESKSVKDYLKKKKQQNKSHFCLWKNWAADH